MEIGEEVFPFLGLYKGKAVQRSIEYFKGSDEVFLLAYARKRKLGFFITFAKPSFLIEEELGMESWVQGKKDLKGFGGFFVISLFA